MVFAFYMLLPLPAFIVLGVWIFMQVANLGGGGQSNIAWWAHIGGFAVGMVLVLLFKHRHVKILGAGHLDQTARPDAVAATVSVTPKTDEPGLWAPEIKGPWARKAPTSTETPTKHRSTIPTAGNRDKEQ
jgi:hypothetical protein